MKEKAFVDIMREYGLQTLYYNALGRADIYTKEQVKELLYNKGKKRAEDVRCVRLIGIKGLKEIKRIYEEITSEFLDISFEHEKVATMIRLTETELTKLRTIAKEKGMDISELVRATFNL